MGLDELLKAVHKITGETVYRRIDIDLSKEKRLSLLEKINKKQFSNFGPYRVKHTEELDGIKYYISESEWILVRISGTEPLIRVYAETETEQRNREVLEAVEAVLRSI